MAGYFRLSSLESFDLLNFNKKLDIKIICNSDITYAEQMMFFTKHSSKRSIWLNENPKLLEISIFVDNAIHNKFNSSKKYPSLELKIVPDNIFGFLHSKFGLFNNNSNNFLFLGSMNETYHGLFTNYESIFFSNKPKKKLFNSLNSEFDYIWFHPDVIAFNDKFFYKKLKKKLSKKTRKKRKKNGW
jgi:phosphatidylserine/phosphatidylglycerophosphate/cardiolipin synthase-like enzyme